MQQQNSESRAAGTELAVTVFLHGIGKGGDNANAGSLGNINPLTKQRIVSLGIFNAQNALVASKAFTVTYNSTNGNYTGSADFGALPSGSYTVAVRTDKYLQKLANGIQNITSGQMRQITPVALTAGDMVIDNKIDIKDYNALMNCYSDLRPAKACAAQQKTLTDITDDGIVNQLDYNLFIREIGNRSGDTNPTIVPTVKPSIAIVPSSTPLPTTTASNQPVSGPGGTWQLKFSDEFNGSSLDPQVWSKSWFNGGKMNNVTTNPANVAVIGGNLVLTLSSNTEGALVNTNPSDSGKRGFSIGYGYFEAKVFFPGEGTRIYNWPAWWTDGQNWPQNGEIDIAEGLDTLTSNYHSSTGANNSNTVPGSWANAYHIYAVNRQPGKNDIYWDGKLIRSYATNDGGSPHYLIFNIGAGTHQVLGVGSQVKVDYVRVWQK
jgi:hypothetical protein